MTHPAYRRSEGGFLHDDAVLEIYGLAYAAGVRAFVVPLTKPGETRCLVQAAGLQECEFYSPGYGSQGGDASAFGFLARHYVIVGRALLQAHDPEDYVRAVEHELTRCA
jgi:orotidine-5'-phosphate decarboxylase